MQVTLHHHKDWAKKLIIFLKYILQQGGYSPTGAFSEMYGSIGGGHYSSHYGNLNYSSGAPPPFHPPPASVPWRGSQNFIH